MKINAFFKKFLSKHPRLVRSARFVMLASRSFSDNAINGIGAELAYFFIVAFFTLSVTLVYASSLIASLSISGVPGFSGFVSKWLVYQGVLLYILGATSSVQVLFGAVCLLAAMFGSALTIATLMKFIHSVFLGQRLDTVKARDITEAPFSMTLPCMILAALCVLFGVFAFAIPLKYFIFPAVFPGISVNAVSLPGLWSASLAAFLVLVGLGVGWMIFAAGKFGRSVREDSRFCGGEEAAAPGSARNEAA